MTYDDLVAYLTAAIDRDVDPNPNAVEIVDGTAGEGDEIIASQLLARLVAAKDRLDRSSAPVVAARDALQALDTAYEARLASWSASRATLFVELDRDTRVVEELIRGVAPLNPTPPPDYLDARVDAMTPAVPGDPGDPNAVIQRAGIAIDAGRRYLIDANILAGLEHALRLFDTQPPRDPQPPRWRAIAAARTAESSAESSRLAYTAAFEAAHTFVTYLQSTPP